MDIVAQTQLIGDFLLKSGLVSESQLQSLTQEIEAEETSRPVDFESFLIEKNVLSEENLLDVYSQHLGMPYCDLSAVAIDPDAVSLIPAKFANKNRLIAIKTDGQRLTVALRNPFDINVLDELRVFTRREVDLVLSKRDDILHAIQTHYGTGAETVEKLVEDSQPVVPDINALTIESESDLEAIARDASIINYVNQLLLEAYQKRATDIHIEPFQDRLRIRYRIDGILIEANTPANVKKLHVAIISRLKIMSNLNIAERRRPQDGRCKIKLSDQDVDLRLSTFPTLFGEGISIRLLSSSSILRDIDKIGLSKSDFATLKSTLKKPNGIILVTGPTGCGKTTTLYACINYLNDDRVNIVTLEDPIEYQLDGINQIQTNPKVDLTFANGFRSILRQDPDVILVGEIRDIDTAQIAIRASLTGHLILSTLHTNNAPSTLTRLLDLGIEPYFISNTLRAVLAQRLVGLICDECKKAYTPSPDLLKRIGLKKKNLPKDFKFYKGTGCASCNDTGYKGRIAIFELLSMDEKISGLISSGAPSAQIEKSAKASGMKTLIEDGLAKIKSGLTTIDEVLRVTE